MNDQNNEPKRQKSSDEQYLDRLEFNPELRKSWLNFFVVNFRVVLLLIFLVSAAGIYSYINLPRESNPEVKIPIAIVSTAYPGASPSDVEELITKKLETQIAGLKGLDKVTSTSANSVSSIQVEFNASEDLEDAIRRLKDKVDQVNDLPEDATDPQVIEISIDDQPIWSMALTGPYDGFKMREYGEDVKDELEKITGVREVQISGGDEREFEVAFDPQKLVFYNISSDQANNAIRATNLAFPAGNFDGDKFVYSIRTDSRVYTKEAIENIPVTHQDPGTVVYVRDLAKVSDKAIKKTTVSRLSINGSNPRNAISIAVVKRTGSSILTTADQLKEAADEAVANMPSGMHYDVTFNLAEIVETDFHHLNRDFTITIILVFTILLLIVGLKEAFVAGLAIPLVFFVTFTVLNLLGYSLNFLSTFSLILSLGLLVDDAIVVVSATKQYLRSGKFTPEEAVLLVLNDFKVVLTTTTLTTVWAFLPLLFATGIIGQFIKSIPVTVSITLIGSLFVALMINHPLAAVLERIRMTKKLFYLVEIILLVIAGFLLYSGGIVGYTIGAILVGANVWLLGWFERGGREKLIANAEQTKREWIDDELIKQKLRAQANSHEGASFGQRFIHGIIHFDRFLIPYERTLRKVIATKRSRRWALIIVSAVFILSTLLPITGIVRSEFFPKADSNNVAVQIKAPVGTKLDETDKVVKVVEEKLLAYKEIANFSTITGSSRSNQASINITLVDEDKRNVKSYVFEETLRKDLTGIPGATVTVTAESGGPPTGAAFQAQIAGEDLKELDRIAHDLEGELNKIPGVVNVDISLKAAAPEFTFNLDPVKLEQNNLNAAYVGSTLRMAIAGTEVSTVLEEGKEIKIMARFGTEEIPSLESVQNLQILNLQRQPVYLKDVATIELRPSVDSITRIDQKRTAVITAGATASTNGGEILKQFQTNIEDYNFPNGYTISYGGENEQNQESVLSIIKAMVIAIFLIIATLIIQFNSFRKSMIVLVTIPLALIGVFIGMAIFNISLSFAGLIGILALFGIVVKNAIILVDKINLNIKSGIPFVEAVVDGCKSRLEAIFITSICTILGILPITLSDEFWRGLGSAVIFGLSLSSFLTLFIVPTLFITLIKEDDRF